MARSLSLPLLAVLLAAMCLTLPLAQARGIRGRALEAQETASASQEIATASQEAASAAMAAVAAAVDPCSALQAKLVTISASLNASSPYVVARPSDVLPCTRSVPFDAARDLGTLSSIINYFKSFYGLLHVAKNSPDPNLPSQYDVLAQLQALSVQKWATAEEFYSAVAKAVDGLNDGHTAFEMGCPPFLHRLALPVVGVVEGGVSTVRTAPKSFLKPAFLQHLLLPPFSFDATKYTDAKVVSIEGQPAWEFMSAWAADNLGMYHTLGQKINFAFARLSWNNGTRLSSYGGFSIRTAHPQADFVTMSVIMPGATQAQTLQVPFLSYTPAAGLTGFESTDAYYSTFCAAPKAAAAGPNRLAPAQSTPTPVWLPLVGLKQRIARVRGWPKQYFIHREDVLPVPQEQGQEVSAAGSYWKVYKLKDGKTAVVTISTFMPDIPMDTYEQYVQAYYFFVTETVKAFELADRIADRVLIDVSGNGGGVTTFVPLVVELLLGTDVFATPLGKRANPILFLADTEVVRLMREQQLGYFNFSGYTDLNERPYTMANNKAFFYPIKPLEFGAKGDPGYYSSLFKNSGPTIADMFGAPAQPAFGTKKFAIFSDGTCFSSCSEFTMTLNVRYGIPAVGVGGVPGEPMAFSAAGGGFVSENVTESFLQWFTPEIAALPEAPKAFSVKANLAMRFTNGFFTTKTGVDMKAPIEFTYAPTTLKVDYTPANVADFTALYQDAATAIFGDK